MVGTQSGYVHVYMYTGTDASPLTMVCNLCICTAVCSSQQAQQLYMCSLIHQGFVDTPFLAC